MLAFASVVYGAGVGLRLKRYSEDQSKVLPGFVISVGNLSAGGTGKTPAACAIAEWAWKQGFRVAILSRGYGGRSSKRILEVSGGKGMKANPAEAGDEPCLMAHKLPSVPVIVSKDRYRAGLYAHDKFGTDFYVLDDGFQHLALKRDLDLLLLDAADPFGNGRLLPWGPLREPLSQMARADAFVLTGEDVASCSGRVLSMLREMRLGRPVFRGDRIPDKVILPAENERCDSSCLREKRVAAFSGIARPRSFRRTLEGLGAKVVSFRAFKDHHPFTQREIRVLISEKKALHADFLITTEKDWIRLEDRKDLRPNVAYLTIRFDFLPERERFFGMVKDAIGRRV